MSFKTTRLLVTRRLPQAVLDRASRDYTALLNDTDTVYGPDELIRRCQDADAALIALTEKFTPEVIAALPDRLRILSTFSVGTDHINLPAARARGLKVGNAPHGVTIATAEIAMLLILGCARRAPEGQRLIVDGKWVGWAPTFMLGQRLDGKKLGILGLGKIGQALAKRARAFDMEIHYHSRTRLPAEAEQGAKHHSSLESLARVSDFLSLNAPSTPETKHILRNETIAWLKPGAVVINTARGDLVRDADLIAALQDGRVAYAGLDVFEGEPKLHPGYLALPNVMLLPHMGSSTIEARNQMGFEALDNIDACFAGRPLPYEVV
jgi:lactate dehydrogenase-like 2-hydroxyacid dehydrogenase